MTAPIGGYVRISLKTMWYTMVNFLLVRVGLIVRLAYAFGDDFGITFLVASVLAICALHACGVLEEITAKRTAHNIIELLRDEFVSLLLVYFLLFLANSALAIETDVELPPSFHLFRYRSVRNSRRETHTNGDSGNLPKLIVRWILPTGSRANQESIMIVGAA